jgi:hypothetical protein
MTMEKDRHFAGIANRIESSDGQADLPTSGSSCKKRSSDCQNPDLTKKKEKFRKSGW